MASAVVPPPTMIYSKDVAIAEVSLVINVARAKVTMLKAKVMRREVPIY